MHCLSNINRSQKKNVFSTSSLHSESWNASVSPFGLFQTEMTVFLTFLYTSTSEISPGSRPWNKQGRGAVFPKFFSALRASVWSKNRGGGVGLGPPGPSPGSATGNPHPFIYLKPEDGTPFGRNFPVKAVVGSTPNPRGKSCEPFEWVRIVPSSKTTVFLYLLMTSRL